MLASERLWPFRRICIWGHPLHSHPHSYIHDGYYRAFKYLGFETMWSHNDAAAGAFDVSGTLFFTEGQVDGCIPIRPDCFYVLHNSDLNRFHAVAPNCLALQVYTHAVRDRFEAKVESIEQIAPFTYFGHLHSGIQILYQPWATDLLPHEIDLAAAAAPRRKIVHWIGMIWDGVFGNIDQLRPFMAACAEHSIQFEHHGGISHEEHLRLIHDSLIAPAIVGKWQCDNGYIPCRIFKNVSYGQRPVTNSPTVTELFEERLIYNCNTYDLVTDALETPPDVALVREQMRFVQSRHTYVDRLQRILDCMFG